ncbi:MAG: aldo/keto reductase [Alphaproteobacteria bacterium]|nr:MAG: aldo/keto reductase [Alphaproteobacteria bacterium]
MANSSASRCLLTKHLSRVGFLRFAAGMGATLVIHRSAVAQTRNDGAQMQTRPIPSSGEALPVIGCGTYVGFDVAANSDKLKALADVVRTLRDAGGKAFDSSPMYGRAEAVLGELLAGAPDPKRTFIATKVWTRGRQAGIAQMERSFALLKAGRIDLMQVHNLVDWQTHLTTLRRWKEDGRIRYLGVTHYTASAYDELEAVMRKETLDFVQLNYSLDDRAAERKLLPLAADRGIGILVNVPFGGGGLLRRLGNRPLPDWAGEIGCTSWPQILLKFVLVQPAVTCVIPGTGNPAHMADNCRAGSGMLPDVALRKRIIADWESSN